MAESNADKTWRLGQELGRKLAESEQLHAKVAKGGEMAKAMAEQAESVRKTIAQKVSELKYLSTLKGTSLGKVIEKAESVVGKRALGKAAVIAGPVGIALTAAQEAGASEDLGPQEGTPERRLESGERLSPEEEQSMSEKKFNIGGMPNESPENMLEDGGSTEDRTEKLGRAVVSEGGLRDSSIQDEMDEIRKQHPEYENVSDKVLTKAILDKRKSPNKADGGFIYDVDAAQLGMGIRTEMEHTDDANIAMKIAMDHLAEDPKYYDKLSKMEKKKLAKGGVAEDEDKLTEEEKLDVADKLRDERARFKISPKQPSRVLSNNFSDVKPVDDDVDYSKYKKGAGKEALKESVKNYNKLKKGGPVPGEENEYAGDPVIAKLNKDELVLNVEQQQRLIDHLNGRETNIPTHDRIDNLLNKKQLSVDKGQQQKLFKFIKGEETEIPEGHIIVKHYEEGGSEDLSDIKDTALQESQSIPQAPNAPYPIAPENPRLPESDFAIPKELSRGVPSEEEQTVPIDETSNVNMDEVAKPVSSNILNSAELENLQNKNTQDKVNQIQNLELYSQLASSEANVAKARKEAIIQQHNLETISNLKNVEDTKVRDEIFRRLNEQDEKNKKEFEQSGIDRFFAKSSTLGKILWGAAIALGTAASFKTGVNPVLNYINKNIDDDLEQKKLSRDQTLAMKNLYLDFQKNEIEKQVAQTNNIEARSRGAFQIAQIEKIQSDINLQRAQLIMAQRQQDQMQRMMSGAAKQGVPVEAVKALPKELQESSVVMPNGKTVKFALDKERAQKLTDYQNEVMPAIAGAKRILDVAQDLNRVTDLTKRAMISSEMKALGGQLRLPFTGPGVLTDQEFERLMTTIGNPNALVSLPSVERAKLHTVINKLTKDLKSHYSNAGIKIDDSANEKNINTLMKNNKGLNVYDAEKALKRTGNWKDE